MNFFQARIDSVSQSASTQGTSVPSAAGIVPGSGPGLVPAARESVAVAPMSGPSSGGADKLTALPPELLDVIAGHLPVKSLLSLGAASKHLAAMSAGPRASARLTHEASRATNLSELLRLLGVPGCPVEDNPSAVRGLRADLRAAPLAELGYCFMRLPNDRRPETAETLKSAAKAYVDAVGELGRHAEGEAAQLAHALSAAPEVRWKLMMKAAVDAGRSAAFVSTYGLGSVDEVSYLYDLSDTGLVAELTLEGCRDRDLVQETLYKTVIEDQKHGAFRAMSRVSTLVGLDQAETARMLLAKDPKGMSALAIACVRNGPSNAPLSFAQALRDRGITGDAAAALFNQLLPQQGRGLDIIAGHYGRVWTWPSFAKALRLVDVDVHTAIGLLKNTPDPEISALSTAAANKYRGAFTAFAQGLLELGLHGEAALAVLNEVGKGNLSAVQVARHVKFPDIDKEYAEALALLGVQEQRRPAANP